MHGVAPQMCRSSSPPIVRRRSRGSLPRLHLLRRAGSIHLSLARTVAPLPAALVRRRAGSLLHRPDANGQALAYVYSEDEPGRPARRHTRMTTTTLGTANQLPSWGIPWGSAEFLLFKTRFGTVGEPNEVICQSQQDRFCLGVRSARHRAHFSGTVAPIGWIVRKSEEHFRRFPESPPTPQARSNTIRCQRPEVPLAHFFCRG